MNSKKHRILALVLTVAMLISVMPMITIPASAAAPTSYTAITTNSTATVSITSSGSAKYFKFVPTQSGTYKFYSTNYTADPKASLLDASGNTLVTNDDGGTDYNFVITYYCTANTTYYIKAYMWSSSSIGSYTLNVQTVSVDCECSYTLQSTTTADCENDGVETYVCSLCGNSYTNTVATALGHNYVDDICTRCGDDLRCISEYNSSTGDVFLHGNYIELGISRNGSFGTYAAPTVDGFHSSGALGMIVDGDGWDIGNPPTTGDFFLPDTPEERYIFSYYYNGIKYEYIVAERVGENSGVWSVEPRVTDQSFGNTLKAVVYGVTQHNVALEITYSFDVNDKNYKTEVSITNNANLDISNVRFVRSFDPDQDDDIYNSNDTYNKVLANPDRTQSGSNENYAMVVARGEKTLEGFFFLSFDNRAFASQGVDFSPDSAYLTGLWEDSHSYPNCATDESIAMSFYEVNGYSRADTGIAITFNLGTLGVSGTDSCVYYSSMSPNVEEDLEEDILPISPVIHSVLGDSIEHNTIGGGPRIDVTIAVGHRVSYQWYINSENINEGGTAVIGATSATYSVPNKYPLGTVEYYYCVVTATRIDNGLFISVTSDPVTVEYLGEDHEYVETSCVEATCTTDGMVVNTCSLCGDDEEITIPKLGHDYVSGICSRCGAAEPTADVWDGSIDTSWYNSTDTEFTIYTAEQLAGLAQLVNNGNTFSGKTIYLGNNIDLDNREWTPIGKGSTSEGTDFTTLAFSGNFNGNGHYIFGLNINNTLLKRAGLFGALNNATITLLGVKDASITITQQHVVSGGVIAGTANNSTITKCDVSGNVSVTDTSIGDHHCASAGMIVGYIGGSVVIDSCIANGSVRGTMPNDWNAYVGGIVGHVSYSGGTATISNTYFCGQVYAYGYDEGYAGGIMGAKFGSASINNCFSIAHIASSDYMDAISPAVNGIRPTTSNSYYTSATSSTLATSTSLSNFQSQSWIETNLGWDFDTVWEFRAGSNYPVLRGFATPHEHSLTSRVVDPTCEEDGYTEYSCTCGYTYRDAYVPNLGHIPGSWIIDVEPTCTTSGRKHTECTRCYETLDNIYMTALGHDIVRTVVREVTCTTPGIINYSCTRCTYSYDDYIYSEHNYVLSDHLDPTCTVDGHDTYTCTICGDSYTNLIPGAHNYTVEITRVATATEEGLITYTCSICSDVYTEIIPMRPDATVLLIQDRLPWDHNDNVVLLNRLKDNGYISGWDMTTTSAFDAATLASYNVVLIANDQTTATYDRLSSIMASLTSFANAGGVVIFGACDQGWAGGNISYQLPEGLEKENFYSRYNYIVDGEHPIVNGTLTDGKGLTNSLLYGNYCSHTYFDTATLPVGTNVILQDAHGNPTLIEYEVGDGFIIASGLTWEFYYSRNSYAGPSATYSKNVFDDLIVYAVYLSDTCEHIYDEGVVVDPTCTSEGYILHTCMNCGTTMKTDFTPMLPHSEGEWTIVISATTTELGLEELRCTVCGALIATRPIPIIDAAKATVTSNDAVIVGQEIEFIVVISDSRDIKSLSVCPIFDDSVFEYVSAEWLIFDATIDDVDPSTMIGVATWESLIDPNTSIYKFTLRAKEITAFTEVSATVMMEDEAGVIAISVIPKTLAVIECTHAIGTYTSVDGTYHIYTCDICGHGTVEVHTFSPDWTCDDTQHWRVCVCGEQGNLANHVYDDYFDSECNDCGDIRYIVGDLENDGDIDSQDAIYLLLSVIHGDALYPLNQPCDFDNDGDVDSDDAVYLLYNSFYGFTDYPLVH